MVDAVSLAGRTVLVTGASSGLGAHFAKTVARWGGRVGLAARRVDRLAALQAQINADGGIAFSVAMDVEDPSSIGPAFTAVEAALGPISGLVNNAGVNKGGAALAMTPAEFSSVFAINVTGAFLCAQELTRRLVAQGSEAAAQGRIVNIASIGALKVLPGLGAYCASKAALVALTKSLAHEWARHGVAVNAICPGYIATDINADFLDSPAGQKMIGRFPRRRLLRPQDLDAPLGLLLGAQASYVTGSVITIDDGQSL